MSAYVPIQEMAAMMLPSNPGKNAVLLFVRGYFDDAGTHADSDVVVWAVCLGYASNGKNLSANGRPD
jgi:hypothetical protein